MAFFDLLQVTLSTCLLVGIGVTRTFCGIGTLTSKLMRHVEGNGQSPSFAVTVPSEQVSNNPQAFFHLHTHTSVPKWKQFDLSVVSVYIGVVGAYELRLTSLVPRLPSFLAHRSHYEQSHEVLRRLAAMLVPLPLYGRFKLGPRIFFTDKVISMPLAFRKKIS